MNRKDLLELILVILSVILMTLVVKNMKELISLGSTDGDAMNCKDLMELILAFLSVILMTLVVKRVNYFAEFCRG